MNKIKLLEYVFCAVIMTNCNYSASNASSDRSKQSSEFRPANGYSSNSDISYASPKNKKSNIYVESPCIRKSTLHDNTNVKDSQKVAQNPPIPAPRANVGRKESNSDEDLPSPDKMKMAERTRGQVSDTQSPLEMRSTCERRYSPGLDSKLKTDDQEVWNSQSVEDTSNVSFEASVDVHNMIDRDTIDVIDDNDDNDDDIESPGVQTEDVEKHDSNTNDVFTNATKRLSLTQNDAVNDENIQIEGQEDMSEDYHPIDASEIKLKKPPPGSKIDHLKTQIEQQVRT